MVAASAGNHALGLAYHGASLGAKITVVMPTGAAAVKVARCRSLGATVVLHGENFEQAYAHAAGLAAESGVALVHPFDDLRVIAGHGTMVLEILDQAPELDTLVVPVGGGGLLAGVATVVKSLRPDVRIVTVEPEHAAGFLAAQRHGAPRAVTVGPTLADGLAVVRVGDMTFAVAAPLVDGCVTVSEDNLAGAMSLLARRAGIVAEGAGAAALAAVLAGKIAGRAIVLPICGRNIDLRVHEQIIAHRRGWALAPLRAAEPAAA